MATLKATPSRLFGLAAKFNYSGTNAEVRSGHPINSDIGRNSRERQRMLRYDKEVQRQALLAEGYELSDSLTKRGPLENLSDHAHAKLMARLRNVDVSALNFKENPPLAVTMNYPASASGPQIRSIFKGISKAIKAHKVYSETAGEVYREVSPEGIYHEHMVLVVPGDPEAFRKWLCPRYRFHCRKQGLLPALRAIHVKALESENDWHKWCGYAAKKSKQFLRKTARLEGGGAWTHQFKPLPKASTRQLGLKIGAQYYALFALLSVHTGRPKDFRTRRVHLRHEKAELYATIVSELTDLDVPWQIPTGVVAEEYECVIKTDDHGRPTRLLFYYGNGEKTSSVEVGTDGLEAWGKELIRRYRKRRKIKKGRKTNSLVRSNKFELVPLMFHLPLRAPCGHIARNRGPPSVAVVSRPLPSIAHPWHHCSIGCRSS